MKKINDWKFVMKNKENKDYILWIILGAGIFVLICFIGIPFILKNKLNDNTIGNADWLSFWGGYVGSYIASILTFFVFFITYWQNEKQHKLTQNRLDEDARISIRPYLYASCQYNNLCDGKIINIMKDGILNVEYFDDSVACVINLSNIGLNHALNAVIKYGSEVDIGHILINEDKKLQFFLPKIDQSLLSSYSSMKLKFFYTDLKDIKYTQVLSITIEEEEYVVKFDTPELY